MYRCSVLFCGFSVELLIDNLVLSYFAFRPSHQKYDIFTTFSTRSIVEHGHTTCQGGKYDRLNNILSMFDGSHP